MTDRRAALKARHRRAILDAAKELISEDGNARLSVDLLAERADVSRRTIFNHFASIDDVVTTVCTEVLGVVIENVLDRISTAPAASTFETVSAALRSTDVPSLIAFLYRALGGFGAGDPRPQQIFQATFSRTSIDLARLLADRHADLDALGAEILVSSLMHGTEVIAHHWIAETGAVVDAESQGLWKHLLDRLIDSIRTGYPT
ncbi:TetR/AcrR family transcriptional regulator [Paractinoplanes atraurantiacus]|uniref:DNA-binding transcriptional regulator, AcrR family n=1 Tax=Paractinoplanes atraurantiacus TaxID=1036182 RepID=A0A285HNA2_9ACTN|nr:TetR/AcrR family transcriptional regulator [Actinoplanes atraurantiacus]SNY37205.1 DNA-binding transcriptional regulator, AcrR family [Actinoplanes atraurantiacus]